ncbi:neuroblast differentiation-associated protein AHNAK-like [Protopterus annectens]|uniref:neuroblast differentiation-associated protein AHNAK-like n=1 Tax=Protopterus annectens TaxID=7888 RepID=UPI001CFBDEB3|nr:neuroblast differentiation-associated protein AHNAK-like [Protopterus annectens]
MSIQIGSSSKVRSRSISDSLSLEEDVRGSVFVKDIKGTDPDVKNLGVKRGDELAGATISFEHLNKDDILSIIKFTESHNAELKLHSKNELKSPDVKIAWPDFNLRSQDSTSGTAAYEKIFNSKIRPRLRSAKSTEDLSESGTLNRHMKAKLFGSNDNLLEGDFKGTAIKGTSGRYNISSPDADINLKSPNFRSDGNIITPKPHGDINGLDIKGPQLDVSTPDIILDKPKGTLKFPEIKGPNIKLSSSVGQNDSSPDVDFNLKTPDMKTDVGISNPKIQGEVKGLNIRPDLDLKGKTKTSDLDISIPKVHGDIKHPDVSGKMPQANIKGPDIKIPALNTSDVDINHKFPNIKGDTGISVPKLQGEINGTNIKEPQLDIRTPDLNIDKTEGKFKLPGIKLPNFKIGEPKQKGPDINLDAKVKTPDMDIAAPKFKGGIHGPDINAKLPQANIKAPDIKMPSIKMSGEHDISAPDVDANLRAPDFKGDIGISAPKIQGDIKGPQFDARTPDINIEKQDGKFKLPFRLPIFKGSGPKFRGPDLDLDGKVKTPDMDISGAKIEGGIKGPDISAKLPQANIKGPNINMPSVNMSGSHNISAPDVDLNLKAPNFKGDVDISAPKLQGDIKGPHIKGPQLDLNSPDIDVEKTGGKFKLPFKIPNIKSSESKFKGPDLDLDAKMKTADIDISTPTVDGAITGPGINAKLPQANIKGPDIKMPSITMSGDHNISAPDVDLNLRAPNLKEDVDLSAPKMHGDIKAPKLKGPELDLSSPDIDGKFKLPFKLATSKGSEPKLKGTDLSLDAKVKTPDMDISVPKVEGSIKGPDINTKLPQTHIKGPNVKVPSINVSGDHNISSPDADLNLKAPNLKGDVDISAPKFQGDLKGPQIDVRTPDIDIAKPDGKFKLPFRLPHFKGSEPKLKGPDLNLDAKVKTPDIDISAPKVEGGIAGPDINTKLPQADIKGPNTKMPAINMSRDHNISAPDIDLNLKAPNLKGGVDISGPNLQEGIKGPNVKGPHFNMNTPDVHFDKPDGKFKIPGVDLPSIKGDGLKLRSPDLDGNTKIKTPDFDVSVPKVEGGIRGSDINAKLPQVDIKGSNIKMPPSPNISDGWNISSPDVDLNLKAPNFKGDVDISAPKLQGDIKGANIKGPQLDLSTPDINLEKTEGKSKMPFRMPNFKVSEPKLKGTDFDLDARLKTPDIDISAPKVEGGIKSPDISAKLPQPNIKGPNIKMPYINMSGDHNISAPDVDVNLKAPNLKGDVDISAPHLQSDIKGPHIDINTPNINLDKTGGKFKLPGIKMPTIKGQEPTLRSPDIDLNAKAKAAPDIDMNLKAANLKGDVDISAPHLQSNIKGPHIDINTPDINLDKTGGKFKLPGIKMPTIKGEEPTLRSPDLDLNAKVKAPNIDISLPKAEGSFKGPDINAKLPQANLEGPNIRIPPVHISGAHNVSVPDADLNLKAPNLKGDVDISAPNLRGDMKGPQLDMNTPGINLEKPQGKFSLPGFRIPTFKSLEPNLKGPDVDLNAKVKAPSVDISAPKARGGIEVPDINMSGNHKVSIPDVKSPTIKGDVDIPSPKLQVDTKGPNIKGPAVNVDSPSGKAKTSWFRMPSFGGKAKVPSANIDGNVVVTAPSVKEDIKLKKDLNAPNMDLDVPEVKPKSKFKIPNFFSKSSTPDVSLKVPSNKVDNSLSNPKMKVDIKSPNIGLGAPEIDMNAPNVDISGTEVKAKTGRFQLPSFGAPNINTDTDVKLPSANIALPGADAKGHKMNMPSVSTSGLELSGPKPDLGLKSTNVKGDINSSIPQTDISGPSLNVQHPTFDVKSPKVDAEISEGNIKLPALKTSSLAFGVLDDDLRTDISGPKFTMPSFNKSQVKSSLPSADINLNAPNIKAGVDVSAAKVDAPGINNGSSSGKFSLPKIPNIEFTRPKGKGLDIDLDTHMSTPSIDDPNIDINLPKSGIKSPHLNLSGSNIDSPSIDLNLKSSTHKGDATLAAPEIKGPKIDAFGRDVNIGLPDMSMGSPEMKMKFPEVKLPSSDFSGPKVKRPDVNLDGNIKSPIIDMSLPTVKGEMKTPEINMGSHMPDIDLTVPDANVSSSASSSKFKLPKFSSPKISMPNIDFGMKSPKIKNDPDLPTLDIKGGYKSPSLDVGHSKYDINASDVDTKAPGTHLNASTFKGPAFDVSGHSVPNIDIDGNINAPDINLPRSTIDGNISAPDVNVKLPDSDNKGPKFKMATFDFSGLKSPNQMSA